MAALTVDFRKHSGPTPADDTAAQIITDCGNFTLDFKQHGFCASPLLLQTLGPWFPNEMQNLLSTKRTLDHWATVQFFFSSAQVRCFWRCLWFRSGLVALFLKTSERGDSWCTDSSFSPLLVKLSQVFESAYLAVFSSLRSSMLLVHLFLPKFFFQSTLHLICFDTALCKQPHLSVMTFCDLPSLWRVSMFVFWIIAKSAVFPIIVVLKNKRYPELYCMDGHLLKLKCKYSNILRYWFLTFMSSKL